MQRKTLIKAAILIICTITFFVSVSLIKNSHKKEHYYAEEKQLNYEQYLSDYATGDVITFQECIGIPEQQVRKIWLYYACNGR